MGTRESTLQRFEMPSYARNAGFFHMTIQTVVLNETLKAPSSDLCWCSFNILSTWDHNLDVITHDSSDAFPPWKGESIKE